jgi:hypothetical protein
MQSELIKIFKNAKYEPSPDLAFSVWRTIIAQDKRTARFKLWSLSLVLFVSSVGLIPAFQILLSDLTHSGFYEYFSLIFSDGGSMITYWKELSFSLAESLPIMSIVFILSLFFVVFLSLKYLFKQIGNSRLINAATLSLAT